MEQASGFALDPDGGERLVFGEATILLRASSEATGGAFTLFEEVPPLVDTPLHVHENEDELFYALEGEHVVQVGDEEFHVRPGGLVFAPRGVPQLSGASSPERDGCSSSRRRVGSRASSESSRPRTKQGRSGPRRTPARHSGMELRG